MQAVNKEKIRQTKKEALEAAATENVEEELMEKMEKDKADNLAIINDGAKNTFATNKFSSMQTNVKSKNMSQALE